MPSSRTATTNAERPLAALTAGEPAGIGPDLCALLAREMLPGRVVIVGDAVPAPKTSVRANDREIGQVTSAAWSPALQRPIALGYVHRDFVGPGTRLDVVHGGARLGAQVVDLPFVKQP